MTRKRKPKIRCAVCGTVATHTKASVPMCDSIPCEVYRQETIREELKGILPDAKEVEAYVSRYLV